MSLKLDYTKKDLDQILEDIREKLSSLPDTKNWTDFLDSDVGYALVKTFAAISDRQMFYLDRQAAETFLDTAEERGSIVARAKALGYNPTIINPASTTVKFQLQGSYNNSILIPINTSLTIENKHFITTSNTIIPPGALEADVLVIQGDLYNNTYLATGEPYYKVSVPHNLSNIRVYVNDTLWEEVDSFLIDTGNPNSYRIYEDTIGKFILFGANLFNYPEEGSSVHIEGVVTLGQSGNTRYNRAPVTINEQILDDDSNVVTNLLGAVTLSAATGGSNAESDSSIKMKAPLVWQAQNRCVSELDYKAIAYTVPGVEEVSSWGGEKVGKYGRVFIAVSTVDGEVPQSLKDAIYSKISSISVIPMEINIISAKNIYVRYKITAYVKQSASLTNITSSIQAKIEEYFSTLKIGDMYQKSDLVVKIKELISLDYINLSSSYITDAIVASGLCSVELPEYIDIYSLVLKDSSLNTVWEYGDSELVYKFDKYEFETTAADGIYNIEFTSQKDDLYTLPNMKPILDTVSIQIERSRQ